MHTRSRCARSGSRGFGVLRIRLGFTGSSGFLALIEPLIGGLHEFGGGKAVGWVEGKTNADGERRRVGLHAKTTADSLGSVLRALPVGVQQENGEFISTVTSGNFRAATVFLHHPGKAIQGAVAGEMAKTIIDAFQVVEVQEKEGKRLARALGATDFTLKALEKFAIVGEPGEPVMTGAESYFLFGFFAFGNIEAHPDAPDDRPRGSR